MHLLDTDVYWYVLFVRTGSEGKVAERLRDRLGGMDFFPFIPQKTCVFRRQGEKSLFQKICFPGYVFIESYKPTTEFKAYAFSEVYKMNDVYKFLHYGDGTNMSMREEERIALSGVLGKDYCIDMSLGFKEGDSVRITSGALVGNESKIMRINRNKHEAVIAVELFGTSVSISVGLEIINKQ